MCVCNTYHSREGFILLLYAFLKAGWLIWTKERKSWLGGFWIIKQYSVPKVWDKERRQIIRYLFRIFNLVMFLSGFNTTLFSKWQPKNQWISKFCCRVCFVTKMPHFPISWNHEWIPPICPRTEKKGRKKNCEIRSAEKIEETKFPLAKEQEGKYFNTSPMHIWTD